jgi:2-hydroxy-3-keto-5-methylthiopentenyl-1-phosphate phosphatase
MNDITTKPDITTDYLVASDFDQTLSFNDSGYALAEILGISDYEEKVKGLSHSNLVQPGAELAYLLRHDPAFRSVRREHLIEAGKRVRLKDNVELFAEILSEGLGGNSFQFFVISAGPREVVRSALEGIVRRRTCSALNWSSILKRVRFARSSACPQVTARLPFCRNWSSNYK